MTYLGWDVMLQRRVAVKEFFPHHLVKRDASGRQVAPKDADKKKIFADNLKKFLEEARQIDKFDHPNLVRLRDYFEENRTAYLVMGFYRGTSLAERMQQQGKMPERRAVEIMIQILEGLKQLHKKRLLHRDIKPQNIYLTDKGQAILLDFGAARFAMIGDRSKTVIYTPEFTPPEQYDPHGEQGPWTDIYACAITLYAMIAGETPPDGTMADKPPAGMSTFLYEVLKRAMAKDLKRRPKDAEAFQALLKKSISPMAPPPRTFPWAWGVSGALLVSFGIALMFLIAPAEKVYKSLEEALREPTKVRVLNLRKSDLQKPPPLGAFVNLEELSLRSNALSALPRDLVVLRHLRKLDLAGNQLTALPRDFARLTALTELDLSRNEFQDEAAVLAVIGRLGNLRTLKLKGCNLRDLSPDIFKLSNLRTLDLSYNQIAVVPAEIGALRALQELRLEANAIAKLPASIKNLKALEKLVLHSNPLTRVPDEMQQLKNLRELDLRANNIPVDQREKIKNKLPQTTVKF